MNKSSYFNILRTAVDVHSDKCRHEAFSASLRQLQKIFVSVGIAFLCGALVAAVWAGFSTAFRFANPSIAVVLFFAVFWPVCVWLTRKQRTLYFNARRKIAVKRINRVLQLNRELREITGFSHEIVR